MTEFLEQLRTYLAQHPPELGGCDSVLSLLYEAYSDANTAPDPKIREDFNQLYQQMNGMPLREMDQIIDPVCTLCRDHERLGFVAGVKVGVQLANELLNQ